MRYTVTAHVVQVDAAAEVVLSDGRSMETRHCAAPTPEDILAMAEQFVLPSNEDRARICEVATSTTGTRPWRIGAVIVAETFYSVHITTPATAAVPARRARVVAASSPGAA